MPIEDSNTSLQPAADDARAGESDHLDIHLAELRAELTRLRGRRRLFPFFFVAAFALLAIGASAFGLGPPSGISPTDTIAWLVKLSGNPQFATLLGGLVIAAIAFQTRATLQENALEAEIELQEVKKRIAARLPAETLGSSPQNRQVSYFDSLVKINIDNLAEYYSLIKVHTNNSFRASLIAAYVGFVFILIGVIAGFWGAATATPAILAAASGIIIEFISGVFFYLYNKTVRELKGYHDSLLSVQNVLLSLKLVSDTEDASARKDMILSCCRFDGHPLKLIPPAVRTP
jgi:hypothetical protein